MPEEPEKLEKSVTIEELKQDEAHPLMEISSVFPFQLFPDSVRVFRNKVVIIKRIFPYMKKEFPILLDDLKSVTVTTGFNFGSLAFEIAAMELNPEPVYYLKRSDALTVRKTIMGLLLLRKKKVSIDNITDAELIESVNEIG